MPRRLIAIAALSFGTALAIIDGAIVNVALPTIARDLRADNSAVVLIVTVYQLIFVMMLLPLSALGQIVGLRKVYQGGQILFAVSSLLCFFANSLPYLLVVRAFQALGAAAAMSVATALLRHVYPSKQLGRGLSVNSVVVSVSAAIAPTLGGGILAIAPWPWVFAGAVPFAVLSLVLGRSLPAVAAQAERYDVLAAIMCAATFGLVISGIEGTVHGDSPVVAMFVVAIGLIIGTIFVRSELRSPRPIMPVDLLGQPILALSVLGSLAAFIAQMTLLVSQPFRLQHVYGFSPAEVGAIIAPWPMTTMIVSPISGYLSDRYPAGILGGIGMAVAVTALVALAWLPPHPQFFDLAWRMALCGAGFGMFLSPNARAVINAAPYHRAASAGGLVSTVRFTGQTLGATVAAALLAMGLGNGPTPALVATGLAMIAGIASVARLRPALRHEGHQETPLV
jgi:DHA2 family multidrug resistance protein-like MFS transporter